MPRALEQLLARLRPDAGEEPDAAERTDHASRPALAPARRRVTVTGRVSAVTPTPRSGGVTDVVVALEPLGSDAPPTELVMLGRRDVAGVRPGTVMRVQGRAATVKGRMTLFNPAYELILEEERS